MVPEPGETAVAWWANTDQTGARRANERACGRDPDAPFDVVEGFFHDVPQDVTREALALSQPGVLAEALTALATSEVRRR